MQQLFVHCLEIINWRNFLFEDDPYRWSEISQWSPKTLKWFQSWYLLPFFTLVWGGRQTDVIFLRLYTGVGWLADGCHLSTSSHWAITATTYKIAINHYSVSIIPLLFTYIHFEHQNCLDHLLPHRRLFDKDKDNKFLQFSLFSHFMLA